MQRSSKFIQSKGRAILGPSFSVRSSSARAVCLVGDCEACGQPLSTNHMTGVFLLPCRHKYHPFYFAVLCATSDACSHRTCTEKIPLIAKCWAIGNAYTKAKGSFFYKDVFR